MPSIVILFGADEVSCLLHQGVKLLVEGVLRCTKPTSTGGIYIFLCSSAPFLAQATSKQTAEHLTDKQVSLSSRAASLQPMAKALQ